ncbi:MAG: hypothetical protein U0572_06190 [Phycisphaerales bacterium]
MTLAMAHRGRVPRRAAISAQLRTSAATAAAIATSRGAPVHGSGAAHPSVKAPATGMNNGTVLGAVLGAALGTVLGTVLGTALGTGAGGAHDRAADVGW